MAARIRKGDTVVVIAGADRGQTGEVLRVIPDENRAVVRGVRIATKHTKATGMGQQGGIVRVEAPIHMSNLQPADPATGKPTRVKFRIDGDKKVRVAKSGQVILNVERTR